MYILRKGNFLRNLPGKSRFEFHAQSSLFHEGRLRGNSKLNSTRDFFGGFLIF